MVVMSKAKIRGDVRRGQIVQAALVIIEKKGVSGLTTANLARKVGMSEANLYRHFKNKDAIFAEAVKSVGDSISLNLDQAIERGSNSLSKLKDFFLLQIDFINKNRGLPRFMFSEELHVNNELRKAILASINHISARLAMLIAHGQQEGVIRADIDPKATAMMFIGMLQGLTFRWSLSGFRISLADEGVKLIRNFELCISADSIGGK